MFCSQVGTEPDHHNVRRLHQAHRGGGSRRRLEQSAVSCRSARRRYVRQEERYVRREDQLPDGRNGAAITEGVRQLRGEAAAQIGDARSGGPEISVVLGNGGMFATSGVLVLGRHPR